MPVERDATPAAYWRSEYLHLAKLLPQAVSSGRVVSDACRKRCHKWRVRYACELATAMGSTQVPIPSGNFPATSVGPLH